MGFVNVYGGDMAEGRIRSLRVKMHGLPPRTIDRDTALSWLRDGHSLVPRIGKSDGAALQLVEVGEDRFVRTDNTPEPADLLPELPSVAGAGV